ncbi:MAG: polysulfide reductase NrfD [Actinobacteria bacterium]|nr:polysulfide reductase NrfD [Actinomycetota bacterium]
MVNEIYTVVNENSWNVFIPLYIFFKGLSVGVFIISALYTVFGMKALRPLAFPSAVASVIFLTLVPVLLVLDLGQPGRFWHLLVPWYFNPTSAISWGAWLLLAYPVALLRYTYKLYQAKAILSTPSSPEPFEAAATAEPGLGGVDAGLKRVGLITLPLAVAADVYTGFLLGVVKANVLWNSALLPGYFLASAIVSGAAVATLISVFGPGKGAEKPGDGILTTLRTMMAGVLFIELFFVLSQWLVLSMAGQQGSLALKLLFGDPLYILGEIIAGMLLPLAILLIPRFQNNRTWIAASAILVLLGGFLMRYTLIFTGLLASRLVG